MEENISKPIISYKDVDIVYGGNLVLSDVTFDIRKGEFVYLLGKVGSGKTSIIRSVTGEIPIRKGEASVGNFNLRKLKNRQIPFLRRMIGVVFQDFQLLMDRSVYDNLLFVLKATGWKDKREIRDRIDSVLSAVGMQLKSHKMPYQLSGGEQQRVAIARALLNGPEIILADEPTGNLDTEATENIMELLTGIHDKKDSPAIIMVTHERQLLQKHPFRTLMCENGECRELPADEDFRLDLINLM